MADISSAFRKIIDNTYLLELYNSDLTLEQIAEKLLVSKSTLRTKINELGLKRTPRFKRKEISKEDIQSLEEQGLSYREIAEKLNIHPVSLLYIRKRLGIYNPPKKEIERQLRATKARLENKKAGIKSEIKYKRNCLELYLDEIVDLLKSGISKAEVARKYNVHPSTVFNLLALYEIDMPVIKKLDGKENVIKRLFSKGLSVQEIANKLECSFSSVDTKIKELNLSREKSDIKINSRLAKEEKLIKKMYEQGCSIQDISEKVKAHPVSVGIKIRKMGLDRDKKISDYRTKLSGQEKEIKKMLKNGKTYKEIGLAFGVSYNTVSNFLKKIENKKG